MSDYHMLDGMGSGPAYLYHGDHPDSTRFKSLADTLEQQQQQQQPVQVFEKIFLVAVCRKPPSCFPVPTPPMLWRGR